MKEYAAMMALVLTALVNVAFAGEGPAQKVFRIWTTSSL